VRSVVVTGNRLVPRDQVLAAARVRVGEPLIRLDTGAVRDRVEAIRQVDVATVERDWPTTVHIVIHERVPVVSVQSGGRYLEIDRYGVTVMSLTAQPRGLLPLAVGDPVQSDPDLRAALAVRQALPPWLSGRVVSMTAASADSVSLRLGNGLTIEWGSPDQAVAKLQILRAMLVESPQHGLRMIDVSTPEVVTTQ
jgi:cell division protein FtsQ